MARGNRFACAGLIGIAMSVLTALPARAATSVDVVSAIRMEQGAAVQVTATVACDPFTGDSFAALALTLFQGTYPHSNYLEGFGGVGITGVDGLICDNDPHSYSFIVRPTALYADKTFRQGPAGTEWVVQVCTQVAPGETECTNVAGPVQQPVLIVQNPQLIVRAALTSDRPNPHRATVGTGSR